MQNEGDRQVTLIFSFWVYQAVPFGYNTLPLFL